jgi:hypothetical protein
MDGGKDIKEKVYFDIFDERINRLDVGGLSSSCYNTQFIYE